MDRSNESRMNTPKIGLIMTTAIASVALSGCTTSAAPPAETSFAKAQVALEKGLVTKAITHAETAVLAEPRNPGFRALLGAAYLEAGRFQSAATSFNDALELGDEDPRTVLSYALAMTAIGDNGAALQKLGEWEGAINPADLGLAYALAGNPERGVHILTNTLRNGHNTAKVRQNLAYTYALAGNWRAARVMAMEDVPADQIDARLSSWAETSSPEDYQVRVAGLLNVTPTSDSGQPQYLALANFPSHGMMVAEAEAQAPLEVAEAPAEPSEAEALAFGAQPVEAAPAIAAAPEAKPAAKPAAIRYVSQAVVQKVPVSKPVAKPVQSRVAKSTSQRRMAISSGSSATHLVQLGSFDSRAVAEAKWEQLKRKFPQLKGRDVVITEAKVNGRTFFRVAAAGFGKSSALNMCSIAKRGGVSCFAYAASNPPKGAVDRGVRLAARTR